MLQRTTKVESTHGICYHNSGCMLEWSDKYYNDIFCIFDLHFK